MKKRQRIRKGLILTSFLLFPVTIYYLSPALILEGAAKGIVAGSFVVFTLQFLTSLVFGRAFCGWLCPGAGLQEASFIAQDKRFKGGRRNAVKYAIWVPWIGLIAFFAIRAGGLHSVQPLLNIDGGVSVRDSMSYIVFYSVVALIFLPALFAGRRAFCHYFCWMAPFMVIGTKIRDFFGWSALHLIADKSKCIGCMNCTKNCPMSLDVNAKVQAASMADSECVLCGTCVDGCPKGAISYSYTTKQGAKKRDKAVALK